MDDLDDKVNGDFVTPSDHNQPRTEIQNVIEGTGQTLGGDLDQLGRGISLYTANGTFYVDSGVADAYVLTRADTKQSPDVLLDGTTAEFIATNTNTGLSTVNYVGLGDKNIANSASAGSILAGARIILNYRLGTDDWLIAPNTFSMLINRLRFTANGTYNPTVGAVSIAIFVTGGGGGGGGVDGQAGGGGQSAAGQFGAAGGTGILRTNVIDASYALVVGAAGLGGVIGNNAGGAGGLSSVISAGVNLVGNGGVGGSGQIATGGESGGTSPPGGTATGGDENLSGGAGLGGRVVLGDITSIGMPGASYWGPGGITGLGAPAEPGVNPGSGGGSRHVVDVATDFAGADGAPGLIVIEETVIM